jgi:hypothetical protein
MISYAALLEEIGCVLPGYRFKLQVSLPTHPFSKPSNTNSTIINQGCSFRDFPSLPVARFGVVDQLNPGARNLHVT